MKYYKHFFTVLTLSLFGSINIIGQNFEFLSDTITTESGLKYLIITKGSGEKVGPNKEVAFHYAGWLEDGTSFGTSRGSEPFTYVTGKGQVIKGAEEALNLMRVGDRYLLIMPPEIAYGERGAGDVIPPNATLTFDYEVMSVDIPKLPLAETLLNVINSKGVNKAIDLYYHLKKNSYELFAFREGTLNGLGYQLIKNNQIDEAIAIFELMAKEYPNSWNAYDSLGEAYRTKGNIKKALKSYNKSLKLNPENENARKVVNELSK